MPAPITSSPLCAWLTYTWTALDMTTVGCTGSSSSDTSACGTDGSGRGVRCRPWRPGPRCWPAEERPARRDGAEVGLDSDHAVADHVQAGDLAVLDEVDAGGVRRAGQAPRHVVVLGDAGARLVGGAQDRIAHVRRDVDDRADFLDAVRVEPLRVHAVEAVRLDVAHAVADVLEAVGEVQHTTLGEEDRESSPSESLPQLERVLVDAGALVPQVVGADDGGVAGHAARQQPFSSTATLVMPWFFAR